MMTTEIAHPEIVSAEEWRSERLKLLDYEKELTKQSDRVNAERRRLPMVKVEKNYEFDGPNGRESLVDLFNGHTQLVVYHFMFDPAWEAGCPGCTGYVDAIADLSTLEKRRTRFVLISRAPLEKLEAYRKLRGWNQPWYSSFGSDFNYDYHATLDDKVAPPEYNFRPADGNIGESHGISVFFRIGDDVYHTYSAYARGTETATDSYAILDLTPYGRQEDFEDSPAGWPQQPTYG